MAVSSDISTVKADISGLCGRNDLDLGRYEVLFLDTILLEKDLQDSCLEDILGLLFLSKRNAADDDIKILSRNKLRCLLVHLLISKVGKQVSDIEYRIIFLLTYNDLVHFTVIGKDNTVNTQRDRCPLIFLESAVIVGLEINGIAVLINGIGLKVESG